MACLLVAVLALTASLAITAGAARAWIQICGNDGYGYCMNDWGNSGYQNPVKMYYGHSSNETFSVLAIDPCHDGGWGRAGGTVNSTCPFQSRAMDAYYANCSISEIVFESGLCVGTAPTGTAEPLGCGNYYGSGAGDGTIMVNAGGGGLLDRYWSNRVPPNLPQGRFVCSSGRLGGPLELNYIPPLGVDQYAGCEWGGLNELFRVNPHVGNPPRGMRVR